MRICRRCSMKLQDEAEDSGINNPDFYISMALSTDIDVEKTVDTFRRQLQLAIRKYSRREDGE